VLDQYGRPLDTSQPQPFLLCCNATLDLQRLLTDDFPATMGL
jgi:hypothetical protein